MPTDFDRIIDRCGTASAKWAKYAGRDVIPLWVADMDFAAPPVVQEALRRHVDHGIYGYDKPLPQDTDAVLGFLARDYGWTVDPEWIVWLPGLVPALRLACGLRGGPGDEVIVCPPIYPPFLKVPALADRAPVTVPLCCEDGRWTLDLPAIRAAFTDRTRAVLLCQPHNPVGRVFSADELRPLVELCVERGVVLCSDEIHCEIILDERKRHVPPATLGDAAAAATVTLMSPSKTYNMAGLYASFAVVPDPGLRRAFVRARANLLPPVNTFGFTALRAAYQHAAGWRAELLAYLRGNRDLVMDAVAAMPGLSMPCPEATFLAWIDCRRAGQESPVACFEEAGVGLSDGTDFGAPGFVRLNFGCPRALLSEALARMARAVEGA